MMTAPRRESIFRPIVPGQCEHRHPPIRNGAFPEHATDARKTWHPSRNSDRHAIICHDVLYSTRERENDLMAAHALGSGDGIGQRCISTRQIA
ncbi:hypothetical protein JOE11_002478 [Robbsia andropogonis]